MGACYSKKAGQLGEAYCYPVRSGSPARLRKRSAMNRTAPYPRHSSAARSTTAGSRPPAHSFGFRRRSDGTAAGNAGGHRAQPVPPPAATPSPSSSDSLLSAGSDANGNQPPSLGKRVLPRPLVARVKPRTTVAGSANSVNVTRSGQGSTQARSTDTPISGHADNSARSGHSSSANSMRSVNSGHSNSARSVHSSTRSPPKPSSLPTPRPVKPSELSSPRRETRMDDSGVATMQGSLSSTASTLSSVSPDDSQRSDVPQKMTKTVSKVQLNPERNQESAVTNRDVQEDVETGSESGEIRDLQVGIRAGGATIALSVNIHKGANPALRHPQVTVHDGGGRARMTQVQRPGFGFTQPAGLTRPVGNVGSSRSGGAPGGVVGGTSGSARGVPSSGGRPPPPARLPGLEQTVRSRVTRWEEKVDQVRRESANTPVTGRRQRPLSGGAPSLAGLRREMRLLTRDVATSPLRRPPLRDTGTCTDSHSGHVASTRAGRHVGTAAQGGQEAPVSPSDVLSPIASSESPESRPSNEDFIDDEIGDQPAFGAYDASSLSPGAFLEEVFSAGLSDPTSPPLPPLQITEALREDYVRPFRLTPRPLTAITTLETPLRRWAASEETPASEGRPQMAAAVESGTTASERRRQMEERAERLARRLGVGEGTPLGSTYQRLGLPDPLTPESGTESGSGPSRDSAKAPTPAVSESRPVQPAPPPRTSPSGVTARQCSTSPPSKSESPAPPAVPNTGGLDSPASFGAVVCAETSHPPSPAAATARPSPPDTLSARLSDIAEDSARDQTRDEATPLAASASEATPALAAVSPPPAAPEKRSAPVPAAAPPLTSQPSLRPAPAAHAASVSTSLPENHPARVVTEPSLPSGDLGADRVTSLEEEHLSDLELRDDVLAGSRPRRLSWRRVSELRELTSPTDSLNSDDLMADYDKDSDDGADDDDSLTGQVSRLQRMRLRTSSSADGGRPSPDPTSKLLRPPRQNSAQDADDWLLIDRDTYMYMAQDFTHTKTMLHKLRRLLQDAETTNPFENSLQTSRRGTSVSSEPPLSPTDGSRSSIDGGAALAAENADLRRQVSALQQQVSDQARTIRLLQRQMGSSAVCPPDVTSVATQAIPVVSEGPNIVTVAPERE